MTRSRLQDPLSFRFRPFRRESRLLIITHCNRFSSIPPHPDDHGTPSSHPSVSTFPWNRTYPRKGAHPLSDLALFHFNQYTEGPSLTRTSHQDPLRRWMAPQRRIVDQELEGLRCIVCRIHCVSFCDIALVWVTGYARNSLMSHDHQLQLRRKTDPFIRV